MQRELKGQLSEMSKKVFGKRDRIRLCCVCGRCMSLCVLYVLARVVGGGVFFV